jgi:pimeloyl-ACP methyl ester carboxylesterase
MRKLGSTFRVIVFDKRGTSLSDCRVVVSTLEERMDDIRAVMDAAGSERAAVMEWSEGASIAMLFAGDLPGAHPRAHHVRGGGRFAWAPDYPMGYDQQFLDGARQLLTPENWGKGFGAFIAVPRGPRMRPSESGLDGTRDFPSASSRGWRWWRPTWTSIFETSFR